MKRSVLIFRPFGYALVALSLFSCSDNSGLTEHADTLHHRVYSILEKPVHSITPPTPQIQYPTKRALSRNIERTSIGLLDSFQLNHCQLGQLIAENNSSLGKLKDGFSKYHADLSIIAALKTCIEHPESVEVKDKLQQALSHKESQLSASLANAFAYDDALRNALSIGNTSLPKIHVTDYNYAVNALERFTRILERWNYTKTPDDPAELIKMLGRLERSNYLPNLFRTMLDYTHKLEKMVKQLPVVPANVYCIDSNVPKQAEALKKAFNTIYISKMQNDIAGIIEQHQRLLMTLENLAAVAPQPELKAYITELGTLSKKLTNASVDFVRPWQKFYDSCNFTPGLT